MTDYGSMSYWDERYASEDTEYDWYQDFSSLKPYLLPHLRNTADFEILIPGCGNSTLGAKLYDSGYRNITCIDFSSVVVAQMQNRYHNKEEMECTVMDARNMELLPNDCFDVIIDKALLDSLLCSTTNYKDVSLYLNEMYRILKGSYGKFIVISHGSPIDSGRLEYLKHASSNISGGELKWSNIEYVSISKPPAEGVQEVEENTKFHYIYICTKFVNNGSAVSITSSRGNK